jgi:hypothetical protein
MMVSANRFRSIGWIALLLVCAALVMVLAFRVNALRSQVHRTEQQIISLRKEKLYLETEVETRANQQQLKLWNDVEFGYVAPSASQYISNERQLAAFAKPDGPGAPTPIRVASADNAVAAEVAFPAIVSRLTGDSDISAPAERESDNTASAAAAPADRAAATEALGARLAMVVPVKQAAAGKRQDKDKPALAKSGSTKGKKSGSARADKKTQLASATKAATPSNPAKSTKPAKPSKTAP